MANEVVVNLDDLKNKFNDSLYSLKPLLDMCMQCIDCNGEHIVCDAEQLRALMDEISATIEKCKSLHPVITYLINLEKVSQDNQNN